MSVMTKEEIAKLVAAGSVQLAPRNQPVGRRPNKGVILNRSANAPLQRKVGKRILVTKDLERLLDETKPGECMYAAGKRIGYNQSEVFALRQMMRRMQHREVAS